MFFHINQNISSYFQPCFSHYSKYFLIFAAKISSALAAPNSLPSRVGQAPFFLDAHICKFCIYANIHEYMREYIVLAQFGATATLLPTLEVVTHSLTAILEFGHKDCFLIFETLKTFDQSDVKTKKSTNRQTDKQTDTRKI